VWNFRNEVVGLLKDVTGHAVPVSHFIELFEKQWVYFTCGCWVLLTNWAFVVAIFYFHKIVLHSWCCAFRNLGPIRTPGHNVPLIHLFVCLLCFPPTYFLFSLVIFPYFPTSLYFPLRIGPLHFQAGGHKRWPNLGFSCFGLFWVIVFLCSWFIVILRCSNFSYSR